MSPVTGHAPLLVLVLSFFGQGLLMSECRRHTREKKYYPDEPPLKTIVLDNGDVIDCVDYYSQPAMRHPYIRRNAQVRAKLPAERMKRTDDKSDQERRNGDLAGFDSKSTGCPLGSVPFLKATKAGPLNLSAIHDFKRSSAKLFRGHKTIKVQDDGDDDDHDDDHEYATVGVNNGLYTGAEGNVNVWQPIVESQLEMSLSQIWVVRKIGHNIATIEAGWMVHPGLFGDYRSRFFIFTTNDTYESTLYLDDVRDPYEDNHLQFVKEPNNHFATPGSSISSSVYEGDQTELEIRIQRNNNGNWDLFLEGERIGFWPHENYNDGFPFANAIDWGGEIVNKRRHSRHTRTQMGSGEFSKAGLGKAAYIRRMGLYDQHNQFYDTPRRPTVRIDKPGCYDLTYWEYDEWLGSHMTLGGPGYDERKCPN